MRRSTTSAATERPFLGLLLVVELIVAGVLLAGPLQSSDAPAVAQPASKPVAVDAPAITTRLTLRDGRTAELMGLGGTQTADLAGRIAAELDVAADAVTSFWGDDWPRDVTLVLTRTDEEFRALGAGEPDIAATTTARRIVFAPGAATMSEASLRIVLRHEMFHYAAKSRTAPDAPRWLTEGVADYVGRPATELPGEARAAELATLPTDADLDTPGEVRSLAYDRAWWFSRYVAANYGTETLRRLYLTACGNGHPDPVTAIRDTLGGDTGAVLRQWRDWLRG